MQHSKELRSGIVGYHVPCDLKLWKREVNHAKQRVNPHLLDEIPSVGTGSYLAFE